MKKGLLIILSGPSGVGKGTVRKYIMKRHDFPLVFSISMTTREPRATETDGVEYYFVSKEEFQKNIDNDNLLEWAEFVGNRYGTPKDKVDAMRDEGKNVMLEIEVNGTAQVLKKCQGNDVISIFIIPPSLEELENRIRGRGTESDEVVKTRLAKATKEMELKHHYEYIVLNDDLERASEEVREIIRSKMNAKIIK